MWGSCGLYWELVYSHGVWTYLWKILLSKMARVGATAEGDIEKRVILEETMVQSFVEAKEGDLQVDETIPLKSQIPT